MTLTMTDTQIALDKIWIAQQELWNDKTDFRHVRELGLEALERLAHPRHRANACLVVAKAHEGLEQWESALQYWDQCRGLYPEGWNREMEGRLQACQVLSGMSEETLRKFASFRD